MTTTSHEIQLAARPAGWPTPDDFRLVEVELPDPGPGEVLVRNTFLSVDPYMRGRMNDVKSYVPPYALDAAHGRRCGGRGRRLERRRAARWATPSCTASAGASTRSCRPGPSARVDVGAVPASAYLGVLGMPGLHGVRRADPDRPS